MGHVERACCRKKRDSEGAGSANTVAENDLEEVEANPIYTVSSSHPPIYVNVKINDLPLKIATGYWRWSFSNES